MVRGPQFGEKNGERARSESHKSRPPFFTHELTVCPFAPGAGKSTLLRLVMGREEPQEGIVMLGKHSVVPNYYEQNQAEALDPDLTIMQTVERSVRPERRACLMQYGWVSALLL